MTSVPLNPIFLPSQLLAHMYSVYYYLARRWRTGDKRILWWDGEVVGYEMGYEICGSIQPTMSHIVTCTRAQLVAISWQTFGVFSLITIFVTETHLVLPSSWSHSIFQREIRLVLTPLALLTLDEELFSRGSKRIPDIKVRHNPLIDKFITLALCSLSKHSSPRSWKTN